MQDTKAIISQIYSEIPQTSYGDQVRYLQQKIKEHADHPDSTIIEKACNQFIGELMPEDKKRAISEQLTLELNAVKEQVNQAGSFINEGKYPEAYEITKKLSELADRRPIVEDDGESAYFNFSEEFEKLIYIEIEHQNGRNSEDGLKETPFPYFDIYALNGTCLLEAEQFKEAAEEFKKASYWNPANAYVRFQYVLTFLCREMERETWSLSIDNMKYLFRKYDIAQCYFQLAQSYEAGEAWEAAVACHILANAYYRNEDREQYLNALMKETGFFTSYFTPEKLQELSEQYRFPLEPEKTAIGLAYETGISLLDIDPERAMYFLKIASELSDAQEIKDSLEVAEKMLRNSVL